MGSLKSGIDFALRRSLSNGGGLIAGIVRSNTETRSRLRTQCRKCHKWHSKEYGICPYCNK